MGTPDAPHRAHWVGQAKDRARSREAGFDRHLVKPIDFGELEELLAAPRERPDA